MVKNKTNNMLRPLTYVDLCIQDANKQPSVMW